MEVGLEWFNILLYYILFYLKYSWLVILYSSHIQISNTMLKFSQFILLCGEDYLGLLTSTMIQQVISGAVQADRMIEYFKLSRLISDSKLPVYLQRYPAMFDYLVNPPCSLELLWNWLKINEQCVQERMQDVCTLLSSSCSVWNDDDDDDD